MPKYPQYRFSEGPKVLLLALKKRHLHLALQSRLFKFLMFMLFRILSTKNAFIIVAMMNNFIRDLIRDNQSLAWFIIYYFLNKHTILPISKGISMCSDFCLTISLFFSFLIFLSFEFEDFSFTFRFRYDSLKVVSATFCQFVFRCKRKHLSN